MNRASFNILLKSSYPIIIDDRIEDRLFQYSIEILIGAYRREAQMIIRYYFQYSIEILYGSHEVLLDGKLVAELRQYLFQYSIEILWFVCLLPLYKFSSFVFRLRWNMFLLLIFTNRDCSHGLDSELNCCSNGQFNST